MLPFAWNRKKRMMISNSGALENELSVRIIKRFLILCGFLLAFFRTTPLTHSILMVKGERARASERCTVVQGSRFGVNIRVSKTKKNTEKKNTQTRNLAIQIAACAVAFGTSKGIGVWPFSSELGWKIVIKMRISFCHNLVGR